MHATVPGKLSEPAGDCTVLLLRGHIPPERHRSVIQIQRGHIPMNRITESVSDDVPVAT